MDDFDLEKRVAELERRIRFAEKKLNEINAKESRLHNLTLRLAATEMALSEALQKNKMIVPREFEKRVEAFVKILDKEISEKKISNYLDTVWKEFKNKEE